MNRRQFLKIIFLSTIFIFLGSLTTFFYNTTKKTIRAFKPKKYPGKLKSLKEENLERKDELLG